MRERCVCSTKPLSNRRVRSSRVIGGDVGGRGVLAAPREPLSPPPPGVLRATGASSVVGESVGTVWSLSAWIFWLHKDRSCGARLLPQARKTALTLRGSLRGRAGVWAVHYRSVLCKERASQGTLEISSRCQGTALPYFRRGVTRGEMEGYVWREGGAKGWR